LVREGKRCVFLLFVQDFQDTCLYLGEFSFIYVQSTRIPCWEIKDNRASKSAYSSHSNELFTNEKYPFDHRNSSCVGVASGGKNTIIFDV